MADPQSMNPATLRNLRLKLATLTGLMTLRSDIDNDISELMSAETGVNGTDPKTTGIGTIFRKKPIALPAPAAAPVEVVGDINPKTGKPFRLTPEARANLSRSLKKRWRDWGSKTKPLAVSRSESKARAKAKAKPRGRPKTDASADPLLDQTKKLLAGGIGRTELAKRFHIGWKRAQKLVAAASDTVVPAPRQGKRGTGFPSIGVDTNASFICDYAAKHNGQLEYHAAKKAADATRTHRNLTFGVRLSVALAEVKKKGLIEHTGEKGIYRLTPLALQTMQREERERSQQLPN
jgi:hypothetical protein